MTRPIQHLSIVHARPLPSSAPRLSATPFPYDHSGMDVDGKVALITGGSNGIGEGVARHLAGQGAQVVIADIDVARGKAVADELDGRLRPDRRHRSGGERAAVAAAVEAFGGASHRAPECGRHVVVRHG